MKLNNKLMLLCLIATSLQSYASSLKIEEEGLKSFGNIKNSVFGNFLIEQNEYSSLDGVLIEGKNVCTLTPEDKEYISHKFNQGKPIVYLSPSIDEMPLIFDTLFPSDKPSFFLKGKTEVEAYLLIKTTRGIHQEIFTKPLMTDDFNLQKKRYDLLKNRLKQLTTTSLSKSISKNIFTSSPQNLLEVAENMTGVYHYQPVLDDNSSDKGLWGITGNYAATHILVPASVKREDGKIFYYFYVSQQFVLNPGDNLKFYVVDPNHLPSNILGDQPTGAHQYLMESYNPQADKDMDIIRSSPDTTAGQTNVTSSMSWNVGGSVGFFGKDGTINVSGGVSISHSTSYAIPDIAVTNNTASASNKKSMAAWYFTLNNNTPIAKTSFQPATEWLWSIEADKASQYEESINTNKYLSFMSKFSIVPTLDDTIPGPKFSDSCEIQIKIPPSPEQ